MKVVIDANTLAAAAFRKVPPSIPTQIVLAWKTNRAFELIVSEYTLTEVKNTLKDPYFADRLKSHEIGTYIAGIRKDATLIPIRTHVNGVASHPQDDLVIATAIDGKADFIVTRDNGLLHVEKYQGVQIIDPYTFFHLIRRSL
ncbi:MAG: putative toxin-antitoxin system toxin component, PIN family [Ktedonobacteraceae bacterium]